MAALVAAVSNTVPTACDVTKANSAPIVLARDERKIKLLSRIIDIPDGREFPDGFCITQTPTIRGTAPYVIACAAVPTKELRERITSLGAKILGYVPNNALIIETDAVTLEKLSHEPDVVAAVEFTPEDKLSPVLKERLKTAQGKIDITVTTLADADVATVKERLASSGAELISGAIHDHDYFTVRVDASEISKLVASADVRWIESWNRPQLLNNRICDERATNANAVRGKTATRGISLTGEGQKIMVLDSGLDTGDLATLNVDLRNQQFADIVCYGRYEDENTHEVTLSVAKDKYGHGTHVSGTVCGTGANSKNNEFKGVAYGAKMRMMSANGPQLNGVYLNDTLPAASAYLWEFDTYNYRIHSNSWGAPSYGYYDKNCLTVDSVTWTNRTLTIVGAAGNGGTMADVENSPLHSPGCAKNSLCVGSVRNYHSHKNGTLNAENPDQTCTLAESSSRGPMRDGRIKPDICATGESVISVLAEESAFAEYERNPKYAPLSGTSMATPTTSGNVALLREWLIKNRGYADPSSALVKAMLCGGAVDIFYEKDSRPDSASMSKDYAKGPVPYIDQGWGRLNLADTIAPLGGIGIYFADDLAFAQDKNFIFTVTTTNNAPFSAQLAWVDAPAEGSSLSTLVNDLDLTVTAVTNGTDVTTWYGNGGTSPDEVNNNESVRIADAPAAVYTVRVSCPRVVYNHLEGGAAAIYLRGAFAESAVVTGGSDEPAAATATTLVIDGIPEQYHDDEGKVFYGVSNLVGRQSYTLEMLDVGIENEAHNVRHGIQAYTFYWRDKGATEWVQIENSSISAKKDEGITFTALDSKEYRLVWEWADQMKHTVISDTSGLCVSLGGNSYVADRFEGWLESGKKATFYAYDGNNSTTSTFMWSSLSAEDATGVAIRSAYKATNSRLECVPLRPVTVRVKEIPVPESGVVTGKFSVVGSPANYFADGKPEYFTDVALANNTVTNLVISHEVAIADDGITKLKIGGYHVDTKLLNDAWLIGPYTPVQNRDYYSLLNSYEYTQKGATEKRLVWCWTNAYHMVVSATDGKFRFNGGSSTTNYVDQYFAVGDTVLIWFENNVLCDWSGLPENAVKVNSQPDAYQFEVTCDTSIKIACTQCSIVNIASQPGYASPTRIENQMLVSGGLPAYGKHYVRPNSEVDFCAPEGKCTFEGWTENLRLYVTGYYLKYGNSTAIGNKDVFHPGTSYHHVQGENTNKTLNVIWHWEFDGRIRAFGGDDKTQVSLDGKNFSSQVVGWYPLGIFAPTSFKDTGKYPETTVTVYGGTNTTSTYEWEGLPNSATFNDETKRIATFVRSYTDFINTNYVANITVYEIPEQPTPPPGPSPTVEYVTVNISNVPAKNSYVATTNGVEIGVDKLVESNAVVTIVATPASGYEYATVPADWTAGSAAGTITRDFTASTNPTAITVPDATEIYVPPMPGDELIVNGGFENFDTSEFLPVQGFPASFTGNWKGYMNTTSFSASKCYGLWTTGSKLAGTGSTITGSPYSGNYACCISGYCNNGGFVWTTFTTPAASTTATKYRLSFYARRAVSKKTTSLIVEVVDPTKATKYSENIQVVTNSIALTLVSEWSRYEADIAALSPSTDYAVRFRTGESSDSQIVLDDVSLKPQVVTPTVEYVTVNISNDSSKDSYVVTTNGVEIGVDKLVESNAVVTIVATPASGYEYATVPADWTAGSAAGTITRNFTASTDPTAITVPDATEIYVPPVPHSHVWGNWATNVYPTCTTPGNETRSCTAAGCEEPPVSENRELAALGHNWGEWYTNVVPTVEAAGELRRDCQRQGCGACETEVLPPLPPPPAPPTNWIENVGFNGTDEKWGTLPAGASFADAKLVLEGTVADASYPGEFPLDLAKTNLFIETTARFTPSKMLAAVPADAKAAVYARTVGEATTYWVLAKKSAADENEWVDTTLAADTVNAVKVRIELVTDGESTTARYLIGESAAVEREVYVSTVAEGVSFRGTGEVSALEGWFEGSEPPTPPAPKKPTVILIMSMLNFL